MDARKTAETLHPIERKVLPALRTASNIGEIVKISGLLEVEVMRGLQWLTNKNLVSVSETVEKVVILGDNGLKYVKESMPERRFLKLISDSATKLKDLDGQGITNEEIQISLGILKKKNAIEVWKEGNDVLVKLTGYGKKFSERESFEEKFIAKEFPIPFISLTAEEKLVVDELKKRKEIIRVENKGSSAI